MQDYESESNNRKQTLAEGNQIYGNAKEKCHIKSHNPISALLANVRSLYQNAGCLLPIVEEK